MMPPRLIFRTPHPLMSPDIFSPPPMLYILLPYLYWLYIAPYPSPYFDLLIRNSHREIICGNTYVLGGATPALSLLILIRFFQLIALGECFYFVHVEKTCLKSYSWNVIHPTLPRKYVLVYFVFHYCLLMGGSNYFYIVSLIVWFFISVDCFDLQELFEVWDHIEFHQI